MTLPPFHPRLEDLPRILPIFPLTGSLLLPTGKLPLNIFEPRYLAMVQDCLAWGRILGMIQPNGPPPAGSGDPPVFDTGCAGRVSSFAETDDGRLMITLTGVCRFRVAEELTGTRGYRRVTADWAAYAGDLDEELDFTFDRRRLLEAVKPYLKLHNMDINWRVIESASDLSLTTWLCMACPFEPREKQALLECPDAVRRAETLTALVEMAIAESHRGPGYLRQ
jgi:hypothetical protein